MTETPHRPYDLVLRTRRAVTPTGELAAAICVRDGTIAALEPREATLPARQDIDVGEFAVLPGVVDSHVHVNEPGRTEWEGFATATRAAAAGGVTTIVDMPLNSLPPTVDAAALSTKRAAASGQCFVDVAFWGGAIPGNAPALRGLHDAGVVGFKCFLTDSGVAEFPPLSGVDLATTLTALSAFGGLLAVHAEDDAVLGAAPAPDGRRYDGFVASRPADAEDAAIAALIEAAAVTGVHVHVLHLASALPLPRIAAARRAGVPLTVETCPHYLTFAAEQVPAGATDLKCCPPIRAAADREALWQALAEGTIDIIASDHSPCVPALKHVDTGDFGTAWGGIASLQLALSAVWTQAHARGHSLAEVCRWMSSGTAALAGLAHKGRIAPGADADLVVFAPDEHFTVDPRVLAHRHAVTPYRGRTLRGVVHQTFLRGRPIAGLPFGRMLTREERPRDVFDHC